MTGDILALSKRFRTEERAIAYLERMRWPDGPVCPHCGGADPYRLKCKSKDGKKIRVGLLKCSQCYKQFTVKVGTIFESSHIPVSKWVIAIHLLCASKKSMSAHQFHRMLKMDYKSAWFMVHRLRHAMAADGTFRMIGTIEVDETYVGGRRRGRKFQGRSLGNKVPVVALVQRNGTARAFPVERVTSGTLWTAMQNNIHPFSKVMTDELTAYETIGKSFASHETVNHTSEEYVRGNVHTNTVESFFSLLKRGINGTFHSVSKQHLHRYCDEFAFRWTNRIKLGVDDHQRAVNLIAATEGKRLMFKQPAA